MSKGNIILLTQWILIIFLLLSISGCATSTGIFPHTTGTNVDLTKKNYRVVKVNVVGKSVGFKIFGIIPITSPSYTGAMTDLYSNSSIKVGKAHALVNVIQERSSIYLFFFSIPKLTIRADIIEFTE
jgi:hypothetical protein